MMEQRDRAWICKKEDRHYPKKLQYYDSMPEVLYIRGELPEPDKPVVAIVGARACSRYGEHQAYRFGKILGENGVQVISGLAWMQVERPLQSWAAEVISAILRNTENCMRG